MKFGFSIMRIWKKWPKFLKLKNLTFVNNKKIKKNAYIYIYIYIYIYHTDMSELCVCVCVYIMLFIQCMHSTFLIVNLVMIREWSMEIELSIPWSPISPKNFWKWLNLFTWSFGDKVDHLVVGSNVLEVNKMTNVKNIESCGIVCQCVWSIDGILDLRQVL